MKTLFLIATLFISVLCYSQPHLYKIANETQIALKGYDDLEQLLHIHLDAGKPEKEQRESLNANIKTYYDSLLSINADFNNETIDRDEMRKQRSVVYNNYQDAVKAIYSPSQYELYQKAFYSKSEEKQLKKYLRKYGYIQ